MSTEPERRPGPLPRQAGWQGWRTVAGLAMAAALVAALASGSRYFIGGVLVVLGVAGVAWALARDEDESREGMRYARGPGWWLGWLLSKVPGAGAKVAFSLLSAGIAALGVAELVAG